MRNRQFKIITCLLSVCFVLLNLNLTFANSSVTENSYAIVTNVFDGDSFEAKDINTGEYYRVKMIGVDSKGFDEAYQYTYNRLMGKQVLLTLDRTVASPVGAWNYCYVRENGEVINPKLIAMGYGEASLNNSNSTIYTQYSYIEDEAKDENLGMWDYGVIDSSNTISNSSEDAININTASTGQITSNLEGVSYALAKNIVEYRKSTPFNRVSDVKFVEGMTKDIYDDNKENMHVVTNIHDAYVLELSTLDGISESEAEDIYEYIEDHSNATISDLVDDEIISESDYNKNKYFMTDDDEDRIIYSKNNYMANVNTATISQLTKTGLTESNAKAIISIREDGYTFKTLGELFKSKRINLTEKELIKLLDNLKVRTDINYSNKYEIVSLFGNGYSGRDSDVNDIIDNRNYNNIDDIKEYIPSSKYEDIKDFIYVDEYETSYTNINTATKAELVNIGINSTDAQKIVDNQKSMMYDYDDLPGNIDLSNFDDAISLFTNINTAGEQELVSLSDNMTSTIASQIISYRNNQPFGSLDEFELFMNNNNYGSVYDEIEDYIVLY